MKSLIITETGNTRDVEFNNLLELFLQTKNPVDMIMELENFKSLNNDTTYTVYGIDDLNFAFNTLDLPNVDATGELIIVALDKNYNYIDVDWEDFYETYLDTMDNQIIYDVKFLDGVPSCA